MIGEDMVNTAYDSPVDFPPETQIQESEGQALRAWPRAASTARDSMSFGNALTRGRRTWRAPPISATVISPACVDRACRISTRRLGGLQSSDLIVLAGRPSMGKTALVTNIAYNVAKKPMPHREAARWHNQDSDERRQVVGFFSLEMSAEQLATRILSEQAHISLREDPPRNDHGGGVS